MNCAIVVAAVFLVGLVLGWMARLRFSARTRHVEVVTPVVDPPAPTQLPPLQEVYCDPVPSQPPEDAAAPIAQPDDTPTNRVTVEFIPLEGEPDVKRLFRWSLTPELPWKGRTYRYLRTVGSTVQFLEVEP